MINVLQRLAELDAQNPNIIKEGTQSIEECGMMDAMHPSHPPMPASLNITAGSGEELSNMLATIMQLAGVHKVTPDELGVEHEPMTLTAEPSMHAGPDDMGGPSMRSVIDKLNPSDDQDDGADGDDGVEKDDEETDEGAYDNSPADPTNKNEFDANQHAGTSHQSGSPGADIGHKLQNNPRARTMEQVTTDLFKEYESFLKESE